MRARRTPTGPAMWWSVTYDRDPSSISVRLHYKTLGRDGLFHRSPERESSSAGAIGLDRKDGAGGVEQDALGVRPEDQLAHWGPAAQSDHDELGP